MKQLTLVKKAIQKYQDIRRLERKVEQKEKQLNTAVLTLTDDEVKEYVRGCDAVDKELENVDARRLPLKEARV